MTQSILFNNMFVFLFGFINHKKYLNKYAFEHGIETQIFYKNVTNNVTKIKPIQNILQLKFPTVEIIQSC